MSAPQTNLEKQKRRHRGPLIGMILCVLFAVVLAVYWAGSTPENPGPPAEATPDTIQPAAPAPATQSPAAP